MPEDLPTAVMVLLWLLIGVITLGYLIMEHALIISVVFSVIYYGGGILWYTKREKKES